MSADVMNDVMKEMRLAFRTEAMDLLIELDSALLALEADPGDSTLVHRVFRAIHTIKGSGATAGLAHLARFAHSMEEAFDLARDGRLSVTPDLIDCSLKACDVIRLIVEDQAGIEVAPGESEVTAAFARLLPSSPDAAVAQTLHVKNPDTLKPPKDLRSAFEIVFKPNREVFYSGADPVTLLDDLRELGPAHITARVDRVPPLPSLEPEHCYLWWEILLVTDRDQAAIQEVFVFVEDECEVTIRLREDQAAAVALFGSVPPDALELFVAECEDLLGAVERDALALEGDPSSRAHLDSLFRGIHSIKGNSGVLLGHVRGAALIHSHPLQVILQVTHGLESILDPCRAVALGAALPPVPGETIQAALDSCDAIRDLMKNFAGNLAGGGPCRPVPPKLLERLGIQSPVADQSADGQIVNEREAAFRNTTSQCVAMIAGCAQRLEQSAEPAGPVFASWLRGLKTLSSAARYQNCPELSESVAQQLSILDAAVKTGVALDSHQRSLLDVSFRKTCSVLGRMSSPGSSPQVSSLEIPAGQFAPAAAVSKTAPERSDSSTVPSTIRIDQNKLDSLMRIVGELLVARGAFPLLIRKLNDGGGSAIKDLGGVVKDLKETGSNISRLADELQTSVMSIRMLPVKTVFQKFPRLVRDLARTLGKEVRFVIEGEGIELDKTILEQIGDPLVHVIRNAVDHGIELPEHRLKNGKEASGVLTLRAFHEAGGVVIEVTEDGKGLDPAALKRKAVEKSLITPEAAAAMSDEAAFQLVFLPGLSTAAKLTDVSGRGVGMDVVRSNVHNLHGTIEIRSRPGLGTTFLIKLPTSLMISKGILLEAGAQEYILPLNSIRDMVKVPREQVRDYAGMSLAQVRGTVYSIFHLAAVLGLPSARSAELSIAIIESGKVKYGLVVDRFLTEVEVLVKPLSSGLEECREFQGAAIMGDGRVVLVLNALECRGTDRIECK